MIELRKWRWWFNIKPPMFVAWMLPITYVSGVAAAVMDGLWSLLLGMIALGIILFMFQTYIEFVASVFYVRGRQDQYNDMLRGGDDNETHEGVVEE